MVALKDKDWRLLGRLEECVAPTIRANIGFVVETHTFDKLERRGYIGYRWNRSYTRKLWYITEEGREALRKHKEEVGDAEV